MYDFSEMKPEIHPETFIAEGARIVGRVILGRGASVWYNCVLRADIATITIGENTNIQDHSVVHVDFGLDTVLGSNVTVGHGAILHACRVGANTLIGMGATILDGAVIPENSIVGAGSLVPPKKTYPPGTLILGSPAKVARTLTDEEIRHLAEHAALYVSFWKAYAARGIGGSGPLPPVRRS
jgi:carbonic anhydrase/acetyltransferase-like protein (isoleucine patch superfamily)